MVGIILWINGILFQKRLNSFTALIRILTMLGNGVKRIIFSIYTDRVDNHTSATKYKKKQFIQYKDAIIESHKAYAKTCNADYELFTTSTTDYNNIQFEKIFKLEELSQQYDEVLYFDFDIVPNTAVSFFDYFDLDKICLYNLPTHIDSKVFR